jgi:aarF domain-containing kinase
MSEMVHLRTHAQPCASCNLAHSPPRNPACINNLTFVAFSLKFNLRQASSNGSPGALKAVAAVVRTIPDVPVAVKTSLASLSTSLSSAFSSSGVVPDLSPIRRAAKATWAALHESNLLPSLPSIPSSLPISPDLSTLQASVQSSSLFNGTYTQAQATAIVAAALAAATLTSVTAHVTDTSSTASDADLPTEYDSTAIYHYWSTRPVMLFKRSLETAWLASGFLVGLQLDQIFGEQKKNEKMRAQTLRIAVDRLGPAYIKVAQALSTRVDLLSPAYFEEITLLQDRVAPFPTDQAMEILEVCQRRPCSQI